MQRNIAFSLFLNLCFIFLVSLYTISITTSHQEQKPFSLKIAANEIGECDGVHRLSDSESKCLYIRSNSACWNKGYLNYLEIFYCTCGSSDRLGYVVLSVWLVILFYVLGNTTSEYFVPSVEGLSTVLKLSPTIAGTTLLPLGNGANDVFASIISFTRTGKGDVGLNSVLGGALFITCFVVGILSIAISERGFRVNKSGFIRDVLFFLFTLCCLVVIIVCRAVNIWFALCFVAIYFLYITVVSLMQVFGGKEEEKVVISQNEEEFGSLRVPLLGYVDEEKSLVLHKGGEPPGPSISANNGTVGCGAHNGPADANKSGFLYKILSTRTRSLQILYEKSRVKLGYIDWSMLVYVVELPLYLPRRITIPLVNGEKWSKPFATISSTLAPILFGALWEKQVGNTNSKVSLVIYLSMLFVGITLGTLTLIFTKKSCPPKRFLLPWLVGGFIMSVTWTYIIVEELVSLLTAFGNILGISTSILALTVLAWGNSLGDLISNLSLAIRDGADGTQAAMSGCYAGPLFNTLIGLGLSFVFAAWKEYPSGYRVQSDSEIYETIGFLMMGLLWALVILPKSNMKLDKPLGVGLLSIYLCFLFLRLVKGVGLI